MLQFNIERIVLMRGHKNPMAYLKSLGFTYRVIRAMSGTPKTLKVEYINKLCVALRCTPNDLVEWVPSKSIPLDGEHPLNKLVRADNGALMRGVLEGIPSSKLDQALKLLKKLSEEE